AVVLGLGALPELGRAALELGGALLRLRAGGCLLLEPGLEVVEPGLEVLVLLGEGLIVSASDRHGRRRGVGGRGARGAAAVLHARAQVLRVLDHAPHLGDDLVEEVVALALVVPAAELGLGEGLVDDVLRRERHTSSVSDGTVAASYGADRKSVAE